MKVNFLKKEISIIIVSLLFSNMLIGCGINTPTIDSYNKKDTSISESEKKETLKDSSKEVVNQTEKSDEDRNTKNNVASPQQKAKVSGKVKLYEGTYFDDRRYGENRLKSYCEVVISNITDTSFDFTVYEVIDEEKVEKKVIFLKNTAVFIGDGTKAAFYGKEYTLNFSFPNHHSALPVVTDMEISGFEPLEGKTYVNNGIPGHEFG